MLAGQIEGRGRADSQLCYLREADILEGGEGGDDCQKKKGPVLYRPSLENLIRL